MAEFVYDRRKNAYLQATELSNAQLQETFDYGENMIEAVATITKTVDEGLPSEETFVLRIADRPKYRGDVFYEGRCEFPKITRTLGELQSPNFKFSEAELKLNNVDGFFNEYMAGGENYISFVGAKMDIDIGLRDVDSSFIRVYRGICPSGDAVDRQIKEVTIRARDSAEELNTKIPLPTINTTDFPSAPEESIGQTIPMVLGDFNEGFNYDTLQDGNTSVPDGLGGTRPAKTRNVANFYGGCKGINVGGGVFVFSIGGGHNANYIPQTINDVILRRGNEAVQVTFNSSAASAAGYWAVEVTSIVPDDAGGPIPYEYRAGDTVAISTQINYETTKFYNIIEQAKHILYTCGRMSESDLDIAAWNALAANNSPASSDFTSIRSRISIDEKMKTPLNAAAQLLEQVRCELFFNIEGKLTVSSLNPTTFPDPTTTEHIRQYETSEDSLRIRYDDRLFFNIANCNYAYVPVTGKTFLQTDPLKNQNSIDKTGLEVAKSVDLPALYREADALLQLEELIRFYSNGIEIIEVDCAWTRLNVELGEFISLSYDVGGVKFDTAPMQVREIEYDLNSGAVSLQMLSLANFKTPNYTPPQEPRTLSGYDTLIEEY